MGRIIIGTVLVFLFVVSAYGSISTAGVTAELAVTAALFLVPGALLIFYGRRSLRRRRAAARASDEAAASGALGAEVVCTECVATFHQAPRISFWLGFPVFSCPACQRRVYYPLSVGYRVFYWCFAVLLAWSAVGFLERMSQGRGGIPIVGIPGVVAIIGIVALVRDSAIRGKLSAAVERAKTIRAEDEKADTWLLRLTSPYYRAQRAEAARALGQAAKTSEDADKVVAALIDALGDQDPRVRRNAAASLGHIGDKRALQPLTEAAAKEQDKEAADTMQQAITVLG